MTDFTLIMFFAGLTIWLVIDLIWVRTVSDHIMSLSRLVRTMSAQINELNRRLSDREPRP